MNIYTFIILITIEYYSLSISILKVYFGTIRVKILVEGDGYKRIGSPNNTINLNKSGMAFTLYPTFITPSSLHSEVKEIPLSSSNNRNITFYYRRRVDPA